MLQDGPPADFGEAQVCVDVVDLAGCGEGPWGARPTVELRWELDLTNEETERPSLSPSGTR
jgi:hypothetical protein